jgi:cytoplasmic iron level regulating protein YaaA (DUF328/UPF0246 family)
MGNTTLILVPCCDVKNQGGDFEYSSQNSIVEDLSPENRTRLLQLRKSVAIAFGETHGPDLGFDVRKPEIKYIQAHRRYAGNLYSQIHENAWEKLFQAPNLKLVIVSALYGLVNVGELIRYYNRTMKDHIFPGRTLMTWWKQQSLSSIMVDYIANNEVEKVHDFLSIDYSRAISNLSSSLKRREVSYVPHRYPGLGSGSNYYRGRDINALILE